MMWIILLVIGVGAMIASKYIYQYKKATLFTGGAFIFMGLMMTSFVNIPKHHIGLKYKKFMGGTNSTGIISYNGENGRQADILSEGLNVGFLLNVIYDITDSSTIMIPDDKVGLLTAKDGRPLSDGEFIAPDWVKPEQENNRDEIEYNMLDAKYFLENGGKKGPQLNVLKPGEYKINTYLWEVEIVNATDVPPGFVGVIVSKVGDVPDNIERTESGELLAQPVVDKGQRGIWKETLTPSKYYLNTRAYKVYNFDTRVQAWKYSGNYTTAEIDLSVNDKGEITQKRKELKIEKDTKAADDAMATKTKDGWEVHVNCRLLVQIDAESAPYILSSIGDLNKLEDKVITPLVRSQVRNQGERVDATEFVNRRSGIESEIEKILVSESEKNRVKVKEFRMTSVAIPPELLVPDKRKQLATKLQTTYREEQKAFHAKIETDKAKAQADQQADLVTAQIKKQAEKENKEAMKFKGQGQRIYMEEIAAGQKAMVNVFGEEHAFKLKMMEQIGQMQKESPEAWKAPVIWNSSNSNGDRSTDATAMGLMVVQAQKMLEIYEAAKKNPLTQQKIKNHLNHQLVLSNSY